MGGRGAKSYKIISRLPNYKNAIILRDKLKNYILNPSKNESKAKLFNSMGYNMSNYNRLVEDIKAKLKTNKSLKYKANDNGDIEYQVNMLLGIDKKVMVATGWIITKGSNTPKFVTAYRNTKLKKKGDK